MTDVALILEEIDEEQKNKNNVRCQYCNSLILSKKSAKYISKEVCGLKANCYNIFINCIALSMLYL